jgi:hypothetical protein
VEGFLAPTRTSRTLVVCGEPGIGKSAVWEAAVGLARSRGFAAWCARPVLATPPPSVSPVWSTTMPATTRSSQSRPHSAPAYYLARPASVWITALHCRPSADPERLAGSGNTFPPERNSR